MHIGQRIQRLMKAQNVTTKAMAEHCEVTPAAVSSWFRSGRISKEKLALAARLLSVSTDELIAGDGEDAQSNKFSASPQSIAQTIAQLGDLLQQARPQTRAAVADLLGRYAQDPAGSQSIAQAIALLIEAESGKKPGA